jgi:glycogen debranching enzyme
MFLRLRVLLYPAGDKSGFSDSSIFSACLIEADPGTRQKAFEKELARSIPRNNFIYCLKNSAGQFIQKRDGKTHVIAGYPWFGWWGRDTFVSAPGLTLTQGDKETFLEIMDTMVADLVGPLFPNVGSGIM